MKQDTVLVVRLDTKSLTALRDNAKKKYNMTISQFVRNLLLAYLARQDNSQSINQ